MIQNQWQQKEGATVLTRWADKINYGESVVIHQVTPHTVHSIRVHGLFNLQHI